MKLAVQGLSLGPLGPQRWVRAVKRKYASDPLWWDRSSSAQPSGPTHDSRFKAETGTFPVLYFAWDENTALLETRAIRGKPDRSKDSVSGWRTFEIDVRLDRVADLRGRKERRKVETTVQELTGDWGGYRYRTAASQISTVAPAPTQRLGAALYSNTPCQGFLTPSARNPLYPNLVVFPDRVAVDVGSLKIEPK